MTRVAIIAALPGELKPLVRGWQHESREGVQLWRWGFDGGEWIAACAGAGVSAATRAFAAVESDRHQFDAIISTGWAGALQEQFGAGRVFRVGSVVDAKTGERFSAAGGNDGCLLVTASRVADAKEKQRLAATYQAGLVDMEAAAVARLAHMRGVPFFCVKGVSDGVGERLPDFNRFISLDGRFKLFRFVAFAILRPLYWRGLIQMGENSKRASLGIAESLLYLLDPEGEIRKRNGYPNLKR
jgi:adenosylhomocysteine nucleosidase